MIPIGYRIIEDGHGPGVDKVEIVSGFTEEYALSVGETWMLDKEPDPGKLAAMTADPKVRPYLHRRRVLVVEDWAPVDAPATSQGDSPRSASL